MPASATLQQAGRQQRGRHHRNTRGTRAAAAIHHHQCSSSRDHPAVPAPAVTAAAAVASSFLRRHAPRLCRRRVFNFSLSVPRPRSGMTRHRMNRCAPRAVSPEPVEAPGEPHPLTPVKKTPSSVDDDKSLPLVKEQQLIVSIEKSPHLQHRPPQWKVGANASSACTGHGSASEDQKRHAPLHNVDEEVTTALPQRQRQPAADSAQIDAKPTTSDQSERISFHRARHRRHRAPQWTVSVGEDVRSGGGGSTKTQTHHDAWWWKTLATAVRGLENYSVY